MQKAGFPIIRILSVLAVATLSCSLPVSFLTPNPDDGAGETEIWQSEVDAIKAVTRDQPIPNFLIDPEAAQSGEVFDPNQLLIPLNHLSLESGYTLDFVYRYDGIGGKPFLYARKTTDTPYGNYADYAEANANEFAYLDLIECDGTEAGFFQWVLLNMMGDQFYLYWHSGYHDAEIIASRTRLEELVEEMRTTEFGVNFTNAQKSQALKIDPAPLVNLEDKTVTVRVVWFTRWGGFYESTYTLSRAFPHQVLDLATKSLMEYDCGIMF